MNHVTRFQQKIDTLQQAARIDQLGGAMAGNDNGFRVVPGRIHRFDDCLCQGQIRMPDDVLLLYRPFKKNLCQLRFGGFLALTKTRLIGRLRLFSCLIMADARRKRQENKKQPKHRNPNVDGRERPRFEYAAMSVV